MTTEINTGAPSAPQEAGSISAGADIYRKLDRSRRRSSVSSYAVPVVIAALVLAGGAGAYVLTRPGAAFGPQPPKPAPAAQQQAAVNPPSTPPAALPAAAPAPVEQAAPAAPTHVAHRAPVVHHAAPMRVAAQTTRATPRARTHHATASSALSDGSDANAFTAKQPPASPMTAPPPVTTATPPAAPATPAAPASPPAASAAPPPS